MISFCGETQAQSQAVAEVAAAEPARSEAAAVIAAAEAKVAAAVAAAGGGATEGSSNAGGSGDGRRSAGTSGEGGAAAVGDGWGVEHGQPQQVRAVSTTSGEGQRRGRARTLVPSFVPVQFRVSLLSWLTFDSRTCGGMSSRCLLLELYSMAKAFRSAWKVGCAGYGACCSVWRGRLGRTTLSLLG